MTNLFVDGDFVAHSGETLHEKIECDALTPGDWECLAHMMARRLAKDGVRFNAVYGVPRGGLALADALREYMDAEPDQRTLIVDDVLTTGRSLLELMGKYSDAVGYVVFDRSGKPLPPNVRALFTLDLWKPTHQHYKGGYYRVLREGRLEGDLTPVVVYEDSARNIWVRTKDDFDRWLVDTHTGGVIPVHHGHIPVGAYPRFKPL